MGSNRLSFPDNCQAKFDVFHVCYQSLEALRIASMMSSSLKLSQNVLTEGEDSFFYMLLEGLLLLCMTETDLWKEDIESKKSVYNLFSCRLLSEEKSRSWWFIAFPTLFCCFTWPKLKKNRSQTWNNTWTGNMWHRSIIRVSLILNQETMGQKDES